MNSNRKKKKLIFVISGLFVAIFLIVFIFSYSFAGINSHRLNIPKSTCESKDLPLAKQDSSCEEKVFFEDLARDYSLEDIYEVWGAFEDEQQEVVLDYLLKNDMVKYTELDSLIKNIKVKKISNKIDDKEVTVITEVPKNTTIEVEKTSSEKVDIIEDLDIGIVSDTNNIESYTYDINMNNSKTNYVENDALITISDIKIDSNKKYFVYHLLDSLEAIGDYADSKNLMIINSDKLSDEFSKELEAGKDYSNHDNRIYIVREEVNVNRDGSISFTTNSFSTFHIIGYTVDFYYNDEVYSINGETSILLSQLFNQLNIEKNAANAVDVMFSDEELVSVSRVENDWLLTSLKAFDTEEKLTIIFDNGELLELKVTDDNTYQLFTDFADRNSYFTEAQFTVNPLQAQFTRWVLYRANCNTEINCLTTGKSTKLAEDTTSNASVWGYQYVLNSNDYWFYSEQYDGGGALYNGDGGIHNVEIFLQANAMYANVYAVSRVTFDDSNICTIKQGSASALGVQTKLISVYANSTSNLLGTWSGVFPYRSGDESYGLGASESDAWNFLYSTSENCGHKVSKGGYDGLTVTINKPDKYYYDPTDCSNRSVISNTLGYALSVMLKTRFKVVFNNNGGYGSMNDENFIYTVSKNLTNNSFARTGYSFVGWNTKADGSGTSYSNGQSVSNLTDTPGGTINLYAQWLGDPKDYTVNHYKQKLGGGYELAETETISGKRVGDQTNATAKDYDGFRPLNIIQHTIGPYSNVVDIYYDRKYYDYEIHHKDIDTNKNISSVTQYNAMFGSTINVRNNIKSDIVGYKFIDNSNYLPQETILITSNSNNNVANIFYKYTEVPYTVNYYKKDLGSNTYTKVSEDTYSVNGKLNDDITYNTKTYTGFSNARVEYIDNNGNSYTGSKVNENLKEVNVYYDRNQYNISYSYEGNVPTAAPSLPQNELVEYGATLTLPSVSVPGYEFSWNQTSPITVTDEISIVGTFTPKNDAFYRVRYYLKDTDTELKEMYECLNVIYNETYTVEAPEITGFTLDDSDTKTVVAGYAGSNNEISFVYKPSKVDYTVNYCLEDLDGQRCVTQTEILQGFSLDTISYNQSQIEGFTYNRGGNNSNGIIRPDGSTVVTLYYTRNRHSLISCITKDDDPAFYVCQNKTYKYGEEIEELTKPTEDYYNFYGWIIDTPGLNTIPNTMPDHDINISGRFVRDSANLVIVSNWGDSIVTPIATFVVSDGVGNEVVVMTDNTGTAIVRGLSVGIEYTIVETSCDVGYICDDFIKHTMVDGDNTITFNNTVNSNNKNWLKSSGRNRNVFGEFD